jgi:pyruvate kinase
MFDLAGPKIRTGDLGPCSEIQVWKPKKNDEGKVIEPLELEILPVNSQNSKTTQAFKTSPLFLNKGEINNFVVGDVLCFSDIRGKQREVEITKVHEDSCIGKCSQTIYLKPGVSIIHARNGKPIKKIIFRHIAQVEQKITLTKGDFFWLTSHEKNFDHKKYPYVECTLPSILKDLKIDERVFFDDGKMLAIVTLQGRSHVLLQVVQTQKSVFKLKSDKGINLPDTVLKTKGLTSEDIKNLKLISDMADMVSLSFIKEPKDVLDIINLLKKLGKSNLGLILKIETQSGFSRLPTILLEAMKHHPIGVMIARGDLAVECGFERMAELQEEILWLCEAAGIPCIWATQVLENLAQTGIPSRAEVTDAAMAVRAEAVMLNKGEHIYDAVKTLVNILQRMEKHQYKKRHLYRKLTVSNEF